MYVFASRRGSKKKRKTADEDTLRTSTHDDDSALEIEVRDVYDKLKAADHLTARRRRTEREGKSHPSYEESRYLARSGSKTHARVGNEEEAIDRSYFSRHYSHRSHHDERVRSDSTDKRSRSRETAKEYKTSWGRDDERGIRSQEREGKRSRGNPKENERRAVTERDRRDSRFRDSFDDNMTRR